MTSPRRKRSRLENDVCSSSVMSAMKRTRSDSRVDLEEIYRLLNRTMLAYVHPVTGLLPAFLYEDFTPGWAKNDAWVRDNVYSVLSIWGVSVAYRRRADSEDDRLKAYELEQSVVKLMRGLLFCMMGQSRKVEQFKATLDKNHSLHAKYSLSTCSAVVGDFAWGHLQIDAISLYLLILAEMTAAGVQIIFTLDEVAFIQNLVFYIEEAYRIPDYGIWERGDKTNHGETELNASSIGMAKAALEAISELDLFGPRGSESSAIHVIHDQVAQCATKLNSLLPRESSSKEIDAGLLTIISYPAFAVENPALIQETKEQIIEKLLGKYGCKRFLRDGYQTIKEDTSRLHYEPAELKVFENIECEWPLFFILLQLDALIEGNIIKAKEYKEKLDKILPESEDGLRRVPELFYVPADKVDREHRAPRSQPRLMGKKIQHMSSQSLYILCCLMQEGLLNIGEIDPLNRRLSMLPKPDTQVQVVLLAEDSKLHRHLKSMGITTDTIHHAEHNRHCPVRILPARYLGRVYQKLGICEKISLSGRPRRKLGVIATSQLYSYSYHSRQMVAFTPSFLDHETFYLSLDNQMLVDLVRTDLAYLKSNWKLMGRPTLVLPILWSMVGDMKLWEHSSVVKLLTTLASGYTAGVRIQLGHIQDFVNTSSVCKLHFIKASEAVEIFDIHPSDLSLHRSSTLLQHTNRRESLIQMPLVTLPGKSKKLLGSVRRSRRTPTLKRKLNRESSIQDADQPLTPDSDHAQPMSLKVARAFSSRRYSLRSEHLLSEQGGMISPSPSSTYLKGKDLHEGITVDDVVQKLQVETNIFIQTDYLHYLFNRCGPDYSTVVGGQECTVSKLLEELYQKAAIANLWSLVRHTAGMLRKSVENLGAAATDLLVRQKTFTVGQPNHEIHIAQPRTSSELLQNIIDVCGEDHSAVSLTQEILVYLAMFIRSEPDLFSEMLRLRIGLIQNVMISELCRAQSCSLEDGIEKLLDLSPFDLKHLLLLIFSSKEFSVDEIKCRESLIIEGQIMNFPTTKQLSIIASSKKRAHGKLQKDVKELGLSHASGDDVHLRHTHDHQDETSSHGHWLRRRRLDGALNRVPPEFYSNVWHTLEKCRGICLGPTPDSDLPQYPTIHETTPGELKFALKLESKLNSLPDPEYRQLVVEVLMVLGLAAKSSSLTSFGDFPIAVDHIINQGRDLFLRDQKANKGPALNCCCQQIGKCGAPCGVCVHFYDSAPSGRYGTMSYLAQAVADQLRGFQKPTDECKIS